MKQKKLLTLFLTVATSFSMLVACSNATFAELLQKVQIRRTRNRKQMKIRMLQNNFWLI